MITRHHILKVFVGVVICLAALLIYRSLGRYTLDEIEESVMSISRWRLLSAFGFVVLSYLCLTGFDTLAARYVGTSLAYRQTALASFTALSIGHNLGFAALSSGAVRYRFYSRWGLSGEQIAKIILFCGVTVGLGLLTLAGLALILQPAEKENLLGLDFVGRIAAGLVCLVGPAVYLLVCATIRRPLRLWKWRFEPPRLTIALGQIGIGTLNFACVAACIHQLLAGFTSASYMDVATAYVTANIAALVSHVPGGLGVLEATMLNILPTTAAIGALVAFRVLYFFIPLLVGIPTLIASEAYHRHRGGRYSQQTVM
jgi:Predicted integral membrane protein